VNEMPRVMIALRSLANHSGGVQNQGAELAKMLMQGGSDVTILSLDTNEIQDEFKEKFELYGINFISLTSATLFSPEERLTILARAKRGMEVFSVLKKYRPQILINFMIGSMSFTLIPAKMAGTPILLAERNSPIMYRLPQYRHMRGFLFLSMLLCKTITVQFESYRILYPRFLHSRIKVIPNSVAILPARFKHLDNAQSPLVIGFIGRIEIQKQPLDLPIVAEALRILVPNFRMEVFGNGSQIEELSSKLEEHAVTDKFRIHTQVMDRSEIFSLIDLLIHPALWEGFPNVVAEALSLGIPVVGYADCAGLNELIQSDRNGWLGSRQKGPEGLADLIAHANTILRNPSGIRLKEECIQSVQCYQYEDVQLIWIELILLISFSTR